MADALSCLNILNHEFTQEVLAFRGKEFLKSYPLSFAQIEFEQQKHPALLQELMKKDTQYKKEEYKFSDKKFQLITKDSKIVLPPSL